MRFTILCLLSLTALACNPEKGDTSGGGAPTTGDAVTTGDGSTTGDLSTTGDASVTGGATNDTTPTGTTDDPTGELPAQCVDYCAKLEACGTNDSDGCAERCAFGLVQYQYPGEACLARYGEYLACHSDVTCAALAEGACSDEPEFLAVDACTTELCDTYADRLIECGLADPEWKLARAFECTTSMLEARFEHSDACGDATEAALACGISGTCEQINEAEFCEAERVTADEICG
jgi:hypothetical protein